MGTPALIPDLLVAFSGCLCLCLHLEAFGPINFQVLGGTLRCLIHFGFFLTWTMILLQLLFGDFIYGYHTFWSFSPCNTPLTLILLLWNSSLFLTSPSYLHVSVVCDPLGLPRVASVCTSGSYLLEPGQVTSGYITEENGSSSPGNH